jgi:hypothetical protein
MANEVEMSARLYASKGGAVINSLSYSAVANMTGTDMVNRLRWSAPPTRL